MNTSYVKKGLAVAIIFLLIGVAFVPSITADIDEISNVDDEQVEITTEVCGIEGVKNHTVKLSKEKAIELDGLFDTLKERLDKAESREETVEIFNEAVISLDEYGLLPKGMNVEEAQRLVTGRFQNQRVISLLERTYDRNNQGSDDENSFCLIAGLTSNTFFEGPIPRCIARMVNFLVNLWNWADEHNFVNLGFFLWFIFDMYLMLSDFLLLPLILLSLINPISLGYVIDFGYYYSDYRGSWWWYPATGWVFTFDLNGMKSWKGSFRGDLPIPIFIIESGAFSPGAFGFMGIKISGLNYFSFFLGSALQVKIKYD